MTYAEFESWVQELAADGRLTESQAFDLLEQRRHFDEHRPTLESEYRGLAVGYVAGELLVEHHVTTLLDHAINSFQGRLIYFEPIGYRAF